MLRGTQGLETLVEIDDQPIDKNPRSTPATYVGIWDDIRTLFAPIPSPRCAVASVVASASTSPVAAARRARAPAR